MIMKQNDLTGHSNNRQNLYQCNSLIMIIINSTSNLKRTRLLSKRVGFHGGQILKQKELGNEAAERTKRRKRAGGWRKTRSQNFRKSMERLTTQVKSFQSFVPSERLVSFTRHGIESFQVLLQFYSLYISPVFSWCFKVHRLLVRSLTCSLFLVLFATRSLVNFHFHCVYKSPMAPSIPQLFSHSVTLHLVLLCRHAVGSREIGFCIPGGNRGVWDHVCFDHAPW